MWQFYLVPQIVKSRFQCPKTPVFVENVTILPGTDNRHFLIKSRKIHLSNCVENVTILPGTDNRHFLIKSRKIHLSNCVENVTVLPGTDNSPKHWPYAASQYSYPWNFSKNPVISQ